MARILVEETELNRYFDTNSWKYDSLYTETTFSSYQNSSTWILCVVVLLSSLLLYYVWNCNKKLLEEIYSNNSRYRFRFVQKGSQIANTDPEVMSS
ncbi:hypothetical protein Gasu2_69300 [Galdieria sulphuraria]|uniref:Uncharacterized protein n=1 Tax=Galdieria sulphuraria TaxID=130081 RepID=M2Y154_GALSU|nr:uncharacterized protein Gasu_29870 [Galdieria sulphuraria]EME29544.1 hypothetical protein Gasu_29870 [Galdieria sulphuraria]GJD12863.1 hypothetical protein Gasu2_69300 [Galdieria sulphuraria]|eukprot:XP_005706064.1 hypothetical protein Gasu_29870 [Galdieria sulphuraria]